MLLAEGDPDRMRTLIGPDPMTVGAGALLRMDGRQRTIQQDSRRIMFARRPGGAQLHRTRGRPIDAMNSQTDSDSLHEDSPEHLLDSGQVERFRREGFLVLRGLFTATEARQVARWTDELQAWPEVAGRHMMYFEESEGGTRLLNRMENLLPWHEGFRQLATGPKLRGICGQLLGEPAVLFKDKINFKLPGGGGFEPHQDAQAGWLRYADLHITALLSIDRATLANGCLEVASNYTAGQRLLGNEWQPLDEEQLGGLRWQAVQAEPGDAVFFDSFIPHRSAANHSASPRRVLYLTYNKVSEGDHLTQYYADKRRSYPPDIERKAGQEYEYRV